MASKDLIEGIEAAALECPLCMHRFTSPKILKCVHSFCLECLEAWVKKSNGVLSCPTCREVCQIPEGGLQNLKNNIFISGLLDYVTTLEQKTAPTCSLCSTVACFFCQDCDELYCTPCKTTHAKMKILKHHCIITMKEYAAITPVERFASKPVLCSEHNMPFHFYCDSCKIPVCVGCTLIEHSKSDGHNIVKIKTAFESFSALSKNFIGEADKKLISFREFTNQLKKKKALEISTYKKWEVKITDEANKAQQLIDQYKKEQLQDLESTHQHNLKLLNAHESDAELAIAKFSSMRETTNSLLISPNHVMALMSSSAVSKRMDDLSKHIDITGDFKNTREHNYNHRFEVALKAGIDISKSRLIIIYKHPPSMRVLLQYTNVLPKILIKTRNEVGEDVYIKDLKMICRRRTNETKDSKSNDDKTWMLLDIINQQYGCYQVDIRIPLKSCTLTCELINGPDKYIKTMTFDSSGNYSFPQLESDFECIK